MRRWILWVWCALWVAACQPYQDHEVSLFDTQGEALVGGPKRQLALLDLQARDGSLILVFNQPLRTLRGAPEAEVPFAVALQPPRAVRGLSWEGFAGVRVHLAEPLPPASEFTVEIPAGWRSACGVMLRHPIRRTFRTERPELKEVLRDDGQRALPGAPLPLRSGEGLRLVFDQPVALGSVEEALSWRWDAEGQGREAPERLRLEAVDEPRAPKVLRLVPRGLVSGRSYRLTLGPGVKGLKGPLRSQQEWTVEVEFDPHPLEYRGPRQLAGDPPWLLTFSEPVAPEEVERCLQSLPPAPLQVRRAASGDPRKVQVGLAPGGRLARLQLLAGLESIEGRRLGQAVDLALDLGGGGLSETSPLGLEPAFWTLDACYLSPGQEFRVLGALPPLPAGSVERREHLLRLTETSGRELSRWPLTVDASGFFEQRCQAPGEPGRYVLSLLGRAEELPLWVAPLAQDEEDTQVELAVGPESVTVVSRQTGARVRKVGWRLELWSDPPALGTVQGWIPWEDSAPRWQRLAEGEQAGEQERREIPLPDASVGGLLVAEAFDRQQPELVLSRATHRLAPRAPEIRLQVEASPHDPWRYGLRWEVVGGSGSSWSREMSLQRWDASQGQWQPMERRTALAGLSPDDGTIRLPGAGLYQLQLSAVSSSGQSCQRSWLRWLPPDDVPSPGLEIQPAWPRPGQPLQLSLPDELIGQTVRLQLPGREDVVTVLPGGKLPCDWSVPQGLSHIPVRVEWDPAKSSPRQVWRARVPVQDAPLANPLTLEWTAQPFGGPRLALRTAAPEPGWRGLAWAVQELPGWAAPGTVSSWGLPETTPRSFGPPERWPLLSRSWSSQPAEGSGQELPWELSPKPEGKEPPGLWRALGYRSGTGVEWAEVRPSAREPGSEWKAFGPRSVRPGDRFEAGVRFRAGRQESGSLGLTAQAEVTEGRQPPVGFYHTSGIVKPGATVELGFDYQVDQGPGGQLALGWTLGHGGERHRVDAAVLVLAPPFVPQGGRLALLGEQGSARIPVPGRQPWRLELLPPERGGTVVEVFGPRGSLGQVRLSPGQVPVSLVGGGPGTVEVLHRQGPPIGYRLERLQPDTGITPPWGSQAYLFRRFAEENGQTTPRLIAGQRVDLDIHIVAPVGLGSSRLQLPLPGGVKPLGLRSEGEAPALTTWRAGDGQVELAWPQLPPGETVVRFQVETLVSGDYLWPAAQLFHEGRLVAVSGSGRVAIARR